MVWSGCLLLFLLALFEVVAFSVSGLVDLSSVGRFWLSLSGLFRCLLWRWSWSHPAAIRLLA